MLPFVSIGLAVQEKMEMVDGKGKQIVMGFAKKYPPEKMGLIVQEAQKFDWWRKNPTAAFMKAVGIINKNEKTNQNTNISETEEA